VVAYEASNAPRQGGVEGRREANLPNFPNFRGTRKSGKFTVDDRRSPVSRLLSRRVLTPEQP
jgi:hypothetical protein